MVKFRKNIFSWWVFHYQRKKFSEFSEKSFQSRVFPKPKNLEKLIYSKVYSLFIHLQFNVWHNNMWFVKTEILAFFRKNLLKTVSGTYPKTGSSFRHFDFIFEISAWFYIGNDVVPFEILNYLWNFIIYWKPVCNFDEFLFDTVLIYFW